MSEGEPDPAPNPENPDPAKERFIMLQLIRLGGALLVGGALLILSGKVAGPQVLGYGLLLFGLFEFFAMPYFLAKRWKSPPE